MKKFDLKEFDKEKCWYKGTCSLYNTEECNSSCVRGLKMRWLINQSLLLPKHQQHIQLFPDDCDLESFKRLQEIRENIKKFVDNEGQLLICSKTTGNGKTVWATKMLMGYFDSIWAETDFITRGLFINVPTFFNLLRDNIDEKQETIKHIKENIVKADLVIWDEIGVKELTNYESGHLLSYIDQRLAYGKANIYTGNADEVTLKETLGDRLYSRIYVGSEVINLKGKDKRGAKKW